MHDEKDTRDALPPPPRPKHASLVDLVKEVVNERLDSLVPMNEEQLEILKRSDAEREKRAKAEIEKRAADAKSERFYKVLMGVLAIVFSALEAYRATHH